jgi:hypothetical protein
MHTNGTNISHDMPHHANPNPPAATAAPQADEATHTLVLRHVVRTTGSETIDALLHWARLEFVNPELEPQQRGDALAPLAPAERLQLAKALPADVCAPLLQALELLPSSADAAVRACLPAARAAPDHHQPLRASSTTLNSTHSAPVPSAAHASSQ